MRSHGFPDAALPLVCISSAPKAAAEPHAKATGLLVDLQSDLNMKTPGVWLWETMLLWRREM